MPKECAFFPETANKSGEHLWSAWMDKLFPGKKRFVSRDVTGKIIADWTCGALNWKAHVVCEGCNNGWMSDIEKWHAKPAISDLIAGKRNVKIPQSRANSIALFAFRTAVVLDHMTADRESFFERSARHGFRLSQTIPDNVMMSMAAYAYGGRGDAHTGYFNGAVSDTQHLKMYVCTFAVGYFVFEVAGYNTRGITRIAPGCKEFDSLAVPFWPSIRSGFIWPCTNLLTTVQDFNSFSMR